MRKLAATREGSVQAVLTAAPDQVWRVLTDVTRIGEWSPECHEAAWIGSGPAAPDVGARFRGRNKAGLVRWGRPGEVTVAEAPQRFVYRTGGGWVGDCTEWIFELEPAGTGTRVGTRVTQSYRVLSLPRWAEVLIRVLVPQHHNRDDALAQDLVRLGERAAAEPLGCSS